jgi:hypothetical protein
MALTITTMTPATGKTGGREFVLIQGTDFNILVNTDGTSKMQVFFGTELATRVRVRSVTELDCLTPIHDPGLVNVKVRNTVGPVEATLTNGFTYGKPVIGGLTNQTDLWRVIDALVVEFRRQVIDEVTLGSSLEWDELPGDGVRFAKLAKVPCIVLEGPRVRSSGGVLQNSGEPWTDLGSSVFKRHRRQDIMDLQFLLFGVDDHRVRMFNLLREVIDFFRRNDVLKVLRDPVNPGAGFLEIDMRPPQPEDWGTNVRGNKSDLKFFQGPFTLFGVPVGPDDYLDETRGMENFIIQSVQK